MKTQILASTLFGLALGYNTPHKKPEHAPIVSVHASEVKKVATEIPVKPEIKDEVK